MISEPRKLGASGRRHHRYGCNGRGLAWAVGLMWLLGGCGGDGGLPFLAQDESQTGPRVPYAVVFEGVKSDELASYLNSVSSAAQSTDRPPPSVLILRNRARDDVPRLEAGLRAQGYYDGEVGFRIEQDETPAQEPDGPSPLDPLTDAIDPILGNSPPNRIVYEVAPGSRYRVDGRTIDVAGEPGAYEPPSMRDIGLAAGEPATSDHILEAEQRLLRRAKGQGFPMATLGNRRTVIDRASKTMDVELTIDPGPKLDFARPQITGEVSVDEDFLVRRTLIEPGSPYQIQEVERARRRLIETNLFATVLVVEGPEPDADGRWPVTFEVTERQHRTIGAGVGYRSDDGPNLNAFWEHRNILGAGERLRLEAETSLILLRLEGQLRKPDFLIPDLDLLGGGSLRQENTDAFDSRAIRANLGLERRFTDRFTGTAGIAYRLSEIQDVTGDNRFALFSVPVGGRYDASDDLLDPSTGYRISGETAPNWDTLNTGTTFVKSRVVGTRYFRAMNEPRLVLAFRGSAGAIVGAELEEIPADERFYAGGGGSIRGIPFQLAGPLDDGDPTGGRSVLEANAEVRYQVLGNVEAVLFLDGGAAFESELPEVNEAWQYGTGAGVRYLTPVGPIRLDVGVPIDKREGIDDAWQLYISIGQAF